MTPQNSSAVITQYARRMTIEQRLAEIIRAFCADALSSAVNLNVDLDVMLAVLAQALLAALRARLPYRPPPPTPSSGGSWKPPADHHRPQGVTVRLDAAPSTRPAPSRPAT